MRIIEGLEAAKSALLPRSPVDFAQASPTVKQRIKEVFAEELTLEAAVSRIIGEVRTRGDSALFDYTRRIDGVELKRLEVTKEEVAASNSAVSKELVSALAFAAERVRSFHLAQKRNLGLGDRKSVV